MVVGEEGVGFVGDGDGWRHGDAVWVQLLAGNLAEKLPVAGNDMAERVCMVMSPLRGGQSSSDVAKDGTMEKHMYSVYSVRSRYRKVIILVSAQRKQR